MIFGNNCTNPAAIHTVSWVYAHGQLEEMLGHDILVSDDPVVFTPGVWPTQVTDPDGRIHQCVAFVFDYTCGIKGLVVLPTDLQGCQDAAREFLKLV